MPSASTDGTFSRSSSPSSTYSRRAGRTGSSFRAKRPLRKLYETDDMPADPALHVDELRLRPLLQRYRPRQREERRLLGAGKKPKCESAKTLSAGSGGAR